jgi:hypothetical protein
MSGLNTIEQDTAIRELRRSIFGATTRYRVKSLVPLCNPQDVVQLAFEIGNTTDFRFMPLVLVRELARTPGNGRLVATTLERVIQSPEQLCTYLAIYWGSNVRREPLSAGSKRGLAAAFKKFSEYDLAKYHRSTDDITLIDVLRLVHAKPARFAGTVSDMEVDAVSKRFTFRCKPGDASADSSNSEQTHVVRRDVHGQGEVWRRLIAGQLPTLPTLARLSRFVIDR